MSENKTEALKHSYVKVWDAYIRLFHWLLVVCIIVSFVSVRMDNMDVHFISGHIVLALLIFRILWGLVGSRTALFVSFIRGPQTIYKYLTKSSAPEFESMIGHSPIAALSVIAMILVIGVQVFTGLVSDDELFLQGPLAQYVSGEFSYQATGYHSLNAKIIMGLVILHLFAIAFYVFIRKNNILMPMFSGRKKVDDDVQGIVERNPLLGAIAILVSIAIAVFVFNLQ